MHSNGIPHLDGDENKYLKTGGSLKDGWSYLMPQDKILLYEEVTCAFADEMDGYVKEQTDALKNLYLSKKGRGSFLMRMDSTNIGGDGGSGGTNNDTAGKNSGNEMTFFIQRGLQVVGCVTYDDDTSFMSDLVVRPSAKDGNPEKELVGAVIVHAKKVGKGEILVECNDHGGLDLMYKELGFIPCDSKDEGCISSMMRLIL